MLEPEIRSKVVTSCKQLDIKEDDFEFVKRHMNRIYAPTVESGFAYNNMQLKKLPGQGKLYT